jgi:hypothetical protein
MSAETFETAPVGTDAADQPPVAEPVDQVAELVLDEPAPVDAELSDAGFEMDFIHQGRLGSALIFAFLAAMGLLLALWAAPTPVVITGWVFVVVGGLLAFRQLAGGAAR